MITESEFRDRLNYDRSHLPVVTGAQVRHRAAALVVRRRRRHALTLVAGLTVLLAGGGLAYERHPRVVRPDLLYASGPTFMLPDNRLSVGLGQARAWINSRDEVCYGDDGGSICGPVRPDRDREFTVQSFPGSDGLLGGLVHRPLREASFVGRDGSELRTLVIRFRAHPEWSVVLAVVPRGPDGTVRGPEQYTFTGR